ncbi:MAG: hypothetical protein ACJA01_001372 [Saprospiraceae bacterium]|jgi:hypothetical protein
MKEKNVFSQLQEEKELDYSNVHNDIKKNIEERKGVWSFLGDIIDLYVPKIFSALVGAGPSINNAISSIEEELEK